MVDKKRLTTPVDKSLTKAEKEVLEMITEKFYNIKQMQLIRNCSRQAVYKIVKKLKDKGALNLGLQKVDKNQPTCQPYLNNQVRLHGQEFNIKILWQDSNYQRVLKKSNILYIDGHTIRFYKNSIEIYAGEGTSFFADDESRAEKKSFVYWKKFFAKLENRLKIILIKEGSSNIRIVAQHFSRGDSEIYQNAAKNGKLIKVYAEEDGKLCFITDDSFSMNEDETVHPTTAKPDRGAIDKHINDWRLKNPMTNSQIQQLVGQNAQSVSGMMNMQKNLPLVLNKLEQQIASHLALIQEYRRENIRWRKAETKKIKKNINQSKLGEFF